MGNKRYEKYEKTYKNYRDNNKKKIKELGENYRNKLFFGGNKQIVLERDDFTCQKCGMTNEQHILLFGKGINIHHIDGNGKGKEIKNNNINNLITLCFGCHNKEHRRICEDETKI